MTLRTFTTYSSIVIVGIGIFLIIGTKLGWQILVDPPEQWSPFYSYSLLKKIFGTDFLVSLNYIVGIGFIIVGLLVFYAAKTGKVIYGR